MRKRRRALIVRMCGDGVFIQLIIPPQSTIVFQLDIACGGGCCWAIFRLKLSGLMSVQTSLI